MEVLRFQAKTTNIPAETTKNLLFPTETTKNHLFPAETTKNLLLPAETTKIPLVPAESTKIPLVPVETTKIPLIPEETTKTPLIPAETTKIILFPAETTKIILFPAETFKIILFPAETFKIILIPGGDNQNPLCQFIPFPGFSPYHGSPHFFGGQPYLGFPIYYDSDDVGASRPLTPQATPKVQTGLEAHVPKRSRLNLSGRGHELIDLRKAQESQPAACHPMGLRAAKGKGKAQASGSQTPSHWADEDNYPTDVVFASLTNTLLGYYKIYSTETDEEMKKQLGSTMKMIRKKLGLTDDVGSPGPPPLPRRPAGVKASMRKGLGSFSQSSVGGPSPNEDKLDMMMLIHGIKTMMDLGRQIERTTDPAKRALYTEAFERLKRKLGYSGEGSARTSGGSAE